MKILAIDQASSCGWCTGKDNYGTWDMRTKKDESTGLKLLRFKKQLIEKINTDDIELVAYERVAGRHTGAIIHASKLVAMIESVCEELGIQYVAYSAKEIKKHGCGNGNGSKEKMVEAARDKYGYTGDDDNQADAMHLYYLAAETYL